MEGCCVVPLRGKEEMEEVANCMSVYKKDKIPFYFLGRQKSEPIYHFGQGKWTKIEQITEDVIHV